MTDTFGPDEFRRRLNDAWRAHARPMLLYLRTMACSADAAEEALQEAFAAYAGQLARGRRIRHESAYLYRVARNALMAQARDRRRVSLDAATIADDADWFAVSTGDAASEHAGPDPAIVTEALGELPDEQREAVVLKTWSGLTFKEIGRLTGVSTHTAAGRYRYGLDKLRVRLEQLKQSEDRSDDR